MGTMYGKKPIPAPAIKGGGTLSNGMHMVWTGPNDDGTYDADIYDTDKKTLVSMQHGMLMNGNMSPKETGEMIQMLMESMIDEF